MDFSLFLFSWEKNMRKKFTAFFPNCTPFITKGTSGNSKGKWNEFLTASELMAIWIFLIKQWFVHKCRLKIKSDLIHVTHSSYQTVSSLLLKWMLDPNSEIEILKCSDNQDQSWSFGSYKWWYSCQGSSGLHCGYFTDRIYDHSLNFLQYWLRSSF